MLKNYLGPILLEISFRPSEKEGERNSAVCQNYSQRKSDFKTNHLKI